MRNLHLVIALFLTVFLPVETRGDRYAFSLVAENSQLEGGVICFFAGDGRSVGHMFLLSNDITCVPTEKLVTIPTGSWNIYAERDGYVSSHPYIFMVRDTESPRVDKTKMSMVPSGTIDISQARDALGEGEYIAFFIQNESHSNSPTAVRPMRTDQTTISVPADNTLVPLVIARGNIAAVGDPVRVSKGESKILKPFIRDTNTATVVVQISLEHGWIERAKELRETPELTLTSASGAIFKPMLPIRGRDLWINSLVFFRGVPPGKATLSASGRFWQHIEAPLSVERRAAQLFEPVIPLSPAGALAVRWRVDSPAGAGGGRTECSEGETAPPPEEEAQVEVGLPSAVVIYQCRTETPKDPDDCVIYGTADLPEGTFGNNVFEGLPAGEYTIEFSRPPVLRKRDVRVNALELTEEHLDLKTSGVFGRITRDGSPVHAKIRFGSSANAVSDPESGEYFAEWKSDHGSNNSRVDVIPCDGTKGLALLGSPDPDSGRPFDVEFPDNSLSVEVVDDSSGKPIQSAKVHYAVAQTEDDRQTPIDGVFEVDSEGTVTIKEVSPVGFIDICADAEGYEKSCEKRFQLAPRKDKHLRFSLVKTVAHKGRLLFPAGVRGGHVRFVVDPGIILASAKIAADGTFTYELSESRPDIYLVVSGHNVPLFAAPYSPPAPGDILEISPPAVPLTVITVARRSSGQSAPFTIRIGSFQIPRIVLQVHQTSRNLADRVDASQPVRVPDIAATGQIAVIMGPEGPLPVIGRSTNIYSDVFNTPGLASTLPVLPVGRDGTAVFP
ncbi:MAG: hypothetical protein ACYC7A_21860 [Thermoanaerobaculia bacterium]